MKRWTNIALIAVVVGVGGPPAWGASELHYRNCVNTAKEQAENVWYDELHNPVSPAFRDAELRNKGRIAGCSRMPF